MDPLKLDELAGHARHTEGSCIPMPVEYVPEGQSLQVELRFAAMTVENLPDSHAMHVSTVVAVYVPEYVPAAQAVHVWASSYE